MQTDSTGFSLRNNPVADWWREHIVSSVDHVHVVDRVRSESMWSGRYAFMTLMSAGIAILGLLLSSPAVVIGAMLISPLMGPIIGLGFGLATFDSTEIRSAAVALGLGIVMAVLFTALIVLASPLQNVTEETAARTRPNLFDLVVALFSALAGAYAMVRGREGTVVGVAIATALMPPLAVVGFGMATLNWTVFAGALLLFFTNLMTIIGAAAIMARFYGFGSHLSPQHTMVQTIVILGSSCTSCSGRRPSRWRFRSACRSTRSRGKPAPRRARVTWSGDNSPTARASARWTSRSTAIPCVSKRRS